MDDAVAVGELETATDRDADLEPALQGGSMVNGFLNQALDVATSHELGDDVRLPALLLLSLSQNWERAGVRARRLGPEVEDGDDVRVRAEPAHGLRLALDAVAAGIVETLGLDQRKRDVAVQ